MDERQYSTLQQLLEIVSKVTGLSKEAILSKRRTSDRVAARMLLFNLARRHMIIATTDAAIFFKMTEHSTLVYYMKMHKMHMDSYENPNITSQLSQTYGSWWKYACDLADEVPYLADGKEEGLKNIRRKKRRI